MKEKLTKNLSVKLLSIPLAIIIWFVIINVDDPVSTKNFSNIAVEVLNESYITASGQVYDIVEGNTVLVTVKAKRSIRDKIKASDIKVTANLAEITQFNRVEMKAECTKYSSDMVEVTVKPKMLTVNLEDSGDKTQPIQIATTGVVDSGFYVDSIKASPNMIKISGAESVIEQIAEVRVIVDVSGHQENFKQKGLIPKAYDDKGREIDSSKLDFSHDSITIKAEILPTKLIPIQINMEGETAIGYAAAEVEYGPEKIELAGDTEVLSKIFSIPITINVSGANANLEKNIDLASYLPEGTKLVGDTVSIAIRVTIDKMASVDFIIKEEDILFQNLSEGLEVRFRSAQDKDIPISVMGEKTDLGLLTAEDLHAYIDLEGLEPGTHHVSLSLQLDSKYQVKVMPSISIIIEETAVEEEPEEPEESVPEEPSPEPSPSPSPEPEPETEPSLDDQE